MSDGGSRQFLFVLGCIVCLLAVASALPAADPRLDPPGTGSESGTVNTTAGDWESVQESTDLTPGPSDDTDSSSTDDSSDRVRGPDIEIDGDREPGNEVTIDYRPAVPFPDESVEVEVNGDSVGRTDRSGEVDATVPFAEEMTIAIPDEDVSRTVDVETTATIDLEDGVAPGADVDISAAVGSTPVEDATVSLEGDPVATTDDDGTAHVTLPDSAGPVELRVERGPVAGERTIEVPEPQVSIVSPLVFPKSPAPVEVSAGGTPVEDATVSLENGGSATTGSDGRALLLLPLADEATVTASVGEETATTTVGDLYLRLATLVVLGLGFGIGTIVTYVRFVVRSDARGSRNGSALDGLVADLAVFFEMVGAGFSRVGAAGSRFASGLAGSVPVLRGLRVPSAPSPALGLSLSMPRFSIGGGWQFSLPSIGAGLSSFGRAFGSMPSFGSLFESSDWDRESTESRFSIGELLGADDDDDETTTASDADEDPPLLADEPFGPRGPRAEIRVAWHAFLDRLGVSDRETLTPGQAARRALADGFPSDRVSRLVSIVRDVEYGSREPSPDRILEAHDTATDLIEYGDDGDANGEEGSE